MSTFGGFRPSKVLILLFVVAGSTFILRAWYDHLLFNGELLTYGGRHGTNAAGRSDAAWTCSLDGSANSWHRKPSTTNGRPRLLLQGKLLESGQDTIPPSGHTRIISHAAGYTVISNAYMLNHTWYFVSEEPWAFPLIEHILSDAPTRGKPTAEHAQVVTPGRAWRLGIKREDIVDLDEHTVSRKSPPLFSSFSA